MIDIERFIQIRKQLKISQNDLAAGICTQTTLSNFESGKKIPSFKILNRLCRKLGITTGDIMLRSIDTKVEKNLHQAEEAFLRFDYLTMLDLLSELNVEQINNPFSLIHFYYLSGIYALENNRDYSTATNYFASIIDNNLLTETNLYYLLALNGLGQTHIKLHEFTKAKKCYDQIIEVISDVKITDNLTATQVLLILHQSGEFYNSRHDYTRSNRILRYGYQLGSKYHQVHYMSRILYYLGKNALVKNSKKQARQYLHDARAFARFNHDQYVATKAKQLLDELEIQQSI